MNTTSIAFILKTFDFFRQHKPGKLVLIFLLTLFQGISSGFSIVLLIPLLQLLETGGSDTATEGPALFFQNLAEKTGIEITLGSILIIYVIILSANAFIQYRKSILDARYQQSLVYTIRRRLFRKIIMADWPTLNTRSRTNHLQVLTKEVPNLANYIYFYLRLITTLIITISYTAYALAISPGFTLITILIGGILFFALRKFLSRSFQLGEGFVSSYNRLLKYIDDFWQTVKIAKVHSSEDFYYNKFDEASTSLLDLEFRMQKNYSLPQLIYRISGIIVLVVIVYLGYNSGSIPLASFFILILLFSRIFPQFVAMNTDVSMILAGIASVKLVMKLDEDFPDPDVLAPSGTEGIDFKHEIRLENVSFAYPGSDPLFNNLSAIITANTITAILGESGIGKTTFIDILAGLQKPVSGSITIDGRRLEEGLLPSWKQTIGYLPQDSFFIDGTLRENLVWDSQGNPSDDEILSVLEQVNASHLAERFRNGLDEFIVNYQFTFSGGECQRLALARVLLRKPGLLLLDEATASLDAENEATIMEVLSRLKEKVTIVFVTHREALAGWFDAVIRLGEEVSG
jgi:ATP-binding cassette subfamily C protein